MIHNMIGHRQGISIFCGIGERCREGEELYRDMSAAGVLKDMVMVFGQMNEPPGSRFRVGQTALTMAEYFRDDEHRDVLLLVYYTAVAFGTIYLVTIFHFTLAEANALGNLTWASNAVALIVFGVASDRLGVRKPFMLVGGIGALVVSIVYLMQAGETPSWTKLATLSAAQSVLVGMAYATWMASFTETVEARNPALTATGLAIWGWLIRLVITASFLAVPHVVGSVTPLIEARRTMAAIAKVQAAKQPLSQELLARAQALKNAVDHSPEEWRTWYWICVAGIALFILSIFIMRGRWSPAAARADAAAHDTAVERELAQRRLA